MQDGNLEHQHHTRTHSRHPAGRSPQTPAMERPPSATPELNVVAPELYRPLCKWQINGNNIAVPTCDSISEWKASVMSGLDQFWQKIIWLHPISKPQNNGQFFNHISHCYDMTWDTNPTPTSSQATKHNARRCEFPELCANLRGHSGHHNVQVTWPADVIRWYLSSHTRNWSIGQWPVPTQATGSEQWECS